MSDVRMFALFLTICVLISFIDCHWIGGWGGPPIGVGGFGYGFGGGFARGFGGGFYGPPPPPFFGPPPPPPFPFYG
ncbi:unnamed protein product, partial [Iphiclides podalirius]